MLEWCCQQRLAGCVLICRPLPWCDETDRRRSICLPLPTLRAHRKSAASTCCVTLRVSCFFFFLFCCQCLLLQDMLYILCLALSSLQMKEPVEKIKCCIAVSLRFEGWLAGGATDCRAPARGPHLANGYAGCGKL